ncbi:MAG TPA: GNAT family N-acetyltransferase [Vicinamibacterales bacterium]|jgi:ribosomal-protein-alanine N-acetyltransferase|nr:GNAT family N-acetyltransferase [Vicinamibacterales bacterium]
MHLKLTRCDVRSWKLSDIDSLVASANNRKIWMNLRDAFPYPYTPRDAREFIRAVRQRTPETTFAIAVGDRAVGSIGYVLHSDVERVSAEIGYWLAESCWGRGIVTEALSAVTRYAIETHGLTRIFAVPFAWNTASCRVLEKAGYVLEARLRQSAIKDGRLTDQLQYAFIAAPPGFFSA